MSSVPCITLDYTNTAEYRRCLRSIFDMDAENFILNKNAYSEPLDDETADELSYDETAAEKFMDYVYEKTKDHPLFQATYDIAAGFMFSMDRNIGLTILFSYDYLREFYACFMTYAMSPSGFTAETPCYVALVRRLGKT